MYVPFIGLKTTVAFCASSAWMPNCPKRHGRCVPPDGSRFLFGQRVANHLADDVVAPLFKTIDPFGNTVQYNWVWEIVTDTAVEGHTYYLQDIVYTANPNAFKGPHAKVHFKYGKGGYPCGGSQLPIGAQSSYRSGYLIYHGYYQLDVITTYAYDRAVHAGKVRRYNLFYSDEAKACNQPRAPRRLLEKMRQTGYSLDGESQVMPDMTFDYGELNPDLHRQRVDTLATAPLVTSKSDFYVPGSPVRRELHRNRATTRDLIDIDGDGLPDQVKVGSDPNVCQIVWHKNMGTFFSSEERIINLPMLPWFGNSKNDNEYCSLVHQFTQYTNNPDFSLSDLLCIGTGGYAGGASGSFLNYRIMDLDYDGIADLLVSVDHSDVRMPDVPFPYSFLNGNTPEESDSDAPFTQQVFNLIDKSYNDGGYSCMRVLPHQRRGAFPWVVYPGLGDGNFTAPFVKYMPMPLHAMHGRNLEMGVDQYKPDTLPIISPGTDVSGNTGLWGFAKGAFGYPTSDPFTYADINGDGYRDLVSSFKSEGELDGSEPLENRWLVLLGDEQGNLNGDLGGQPFVFQARAGKHANPAVISLSKSGPDGPTFNDPYFNQNTSISGFRDFNGDGLPDLLHMSVWKPGGLNGNGFPDSEFTTYLQMNGAEGLTTDNLSKPIIDAYDSPDDRNWMVAGEQTRLQQHREWHYSSRELEDEGVGTFDLARGFNSHLFFDYDGDGREDHLILTDEEAPNHKLQHFPSQVLTAYVRINAGDYYLSKRPVDNFFGSCIAQIDETLYTYPAAAPFVKETERIAQVADIDGDGVMDAIYRWGKRLSVVAPRFRRHPPRPVTYY